jgi:hypothetical protein
MNQNIIIGILALLVVVLAGALVYSTVMQKDPVVRVPALSQDEALALARSTWGDCSAVGECSRVSASVQKEGSATRVTAIYEGLHDDSVSAMKKEGVASYANGSWTLGTAVTTYRCQQGRGHQDFSAELCR